ncbi:MAG: hypothetical protein WDM77_17360 [Steroidobacteraceae bacterium]
MSLKTLYNRLEVYNGRGGPGAVGHDAVAALPAPDSRPEEDRLS